MSFATGHALLIGIGSHKHLPHLNVPITVADAKAVGEVLTDEDACGFHSENVRLIHDQQATKDNILEEIYELAERVSVRDTAVIFYCGHGALGEDGNFYLVTHDAQQKGKKIQAATGINHQELTTAINKIKAQKVLLIFNACHSGHIAGTLSDTAVPLKTLNPSGNALNALLGTGEGRVIIVAAKKKQESVIGSGTTTIFTTALIDGLEGEGVKNNGGYIDVYDLYQKIYRDVKRKAKQAGYEQEPLLTCLDVAGAFPVALYQGANPEALGTDYTPETLPSEGNVEAVPSEEAAHVHQGVIQHIDTGGGAYIGGSVNTGGGDFVGRDQNIGGDYVRGNKYGGDHVAGDKVTMGDRGVHARGETVHIHMDGRGSDINPELGDLPPIPSNLKNNMRERLSATDIKTICFDMEISYDALSSGAIYDKINALILYSRQHGRVDELIQLCHDQNQSVDWRS